MPPTKIGKRKKGTKVLDARNFRKSLQILSPPESNSSGSNLGESQFSNTVTVIQRKRALFTTQPKRVGGKQRK